MLPPTRPVSDVSGRIFVFFVDDLHLQFGSTGRVRELFKKISKQLLHDGDLFGIVSSGPSSISVQMTYDKRRLDEAINKMTGAELKPEEIIEQSGTAPGAPSEVRFRVGVAFKTVYELLQNLDKVRDRRKALIYVSDGYDLNPFEDSRLGLMDPVLAVPAEHDAARAEPGSQVRRRGACARPDADASTGGRAVQRCRADLDAGRVDARSQPLERHDVHDRSRAGWSVRCRTSIRKWSRSSGRSSCASRRTACACSRRRPADIAVVNQNDFDKALQRIDAETSDYYVLGYYSSNPDPTQRRRRLEVRVTRPDVSVWSRKEYVLRAVPLPQPAAAPAAPAAK